MSDFEERLRSEVNRRKEELSPSDDLPERIHGRVTRRRRRQRALTGALTGCLAALAAAGLYLTNPSGNGSVETVDSGERTTTTQQAPKSTGPTTTDDSLATSSTEPSEAPEQPEGTTPDGSAPEVSPPETQVTAPPETEPPPSTTTPPSNLKPPDSETPTAGACGAAGGAVVEVVLNIDVPSPRCSQVRPDQRLQVRNATDEQATVSLAGFSATLEPGQSQLFDQAFGDYLQSGVHNVATSLYGGSGPQVYLVP